MDELVRKILNIENRANRMVEDEKQRLSELPKDVEAVVDAKRREMDEKSQTRIDRILESETEDEEKKLAKIEGDFSENAEKLKKITMENKEKWASEIFGKITS